MIKVLRSRKYEKDSLLGFADVQIGDIVVHGVRLIKGRNKIFAQFPQRKYNNQYYDIVHPSSAELRQKVTDAIVAELK